MRPRGDRDFQNHTVTILFVIDEGPHAYVERINIRGNTRTRDYVIRREFDIAEGDAYNRALVDRAERRLKNLNYFKTVKITTEPGSAPDRIIINVDVEEQSTGEFSFSGGYSTSDGLLGEVSVGERNLLGRGQAVRAAVQYGQRATRLRGLVRRALSAWIRASPWGSTFSTSRRTPRPTNPTLPTSIGGNVRFGVPLTDTLIGQRTLHGLYRRRSRCRTSLDNCNNINPDFLNTFPTPDQFFQFRRRSMWPPAVRPSGTVIRTAKRRSRSRWSSRRGR